MLNSNPNIPSPRNEPILNYAPGDPETKILKDELAKLTSVELEIPVIIDGKPVKTGKTGACFLPHNHAHKIATYHKAGPEEVGKALEGALKAKVEWERTPAPDRAAIFLKAAELLSTKYRPILNAATMLGQSKTCYQAEIDSACELIDFLRFGVHFEEQLYRMQPVSAPGQWNRLQYRPLEGFVFSVSPFNFTAIAGNLTCTPALLGNVVIWKPASTAVYSGYFMMRLLEEAGLPPGVIQFLPGSGAEIGERVLTHPQLAGINFTGSTGVFQQMWKTVGNRIQDYKSYPRLVGETGGKDFIFAHASADTEVLATAMIRGAFEYQGQKCSAASRAYIPRSLWPKLKDRLVGEIRQILVGDVAEFRNFMSAVIDRSSFNTIRGYIDSAKKSGEAEIVVGGGCNDEYGYFIEPTIIETKNPRYRTMCEEIFGPVLSVFVYEDNQIEETLKSCDEITNYALTGAIIAQDRRAIQMMTSRFTHSAGNFYVNNKPTGAVVGQQPFGGSRGSGTNDKAGSIFNLMRWVSLRTVSETLVPPTSFRYPFMEND